MMMMSELWMILLLKGGGNWSEALQPGVTLGPNNADRLNPPKGPKATVWDSESLTEVGTGTLRLLVVAISSGLGVWSGTLDGPGVPPKGNFGRIWKRQERSLLDVYIEES
jgi:hypothetical protein